MHDTIYLLNCVVHQKHFFKRLFSKLAHIFAAIELLNFSKMQKFIFIAQESSQYLGFFLKLRT